MKLKTLINAFVMIVAVGCLAACGKHSSSSCDCAICINDQPVYPCDSAESCANFAADQDCNLHHFVDDSKETCGDEPQPRCQVSGCSGQCHCPGEEEAAMSEQAL